MARENYGIFISHRHTYNHFAGRIYDYFKNKGLSPFLDIYSLSQSDFKDELLKVIEETQYFLLLLTPNSLENIKETDMFYKEIEKACNSTKTKILIIKLDNYKIPSSLPKKIKQVINQHHYIIRDDMSDFYMQMDRLYENDININNLIKEIDWKEYYIGNANLCFLPRKLIENKIAPLENRFGIKLIESIKNNTEFIGEQKIKLVRMSCYAASTFLTPDRNMLDGQAYDKDQTMFKVYRKLLEDQEFSLEIIINAPESYAVKEAIKNNKIGNNALSDSLNKVFLGSYAMYKKLIKDDEVFKKAYNDKRFKLLVTNHILPYAFFQMIYKDKWKKHNHIKIDLYSEHVDSATDRRSLILFEDIHNENYQFFNTRYILLKNEEESIKIVKNREKGWLNKWKKIIKREQKEKNRI